MRKSGKRLIAVLWGLMLAAGVLVLPVCAAETAVIPVEIRVMGDQREETFTVELTPETADCPMPAASRLKLTGGSSGSFRIPCDREGVFSYTLRQLAGTDPACTYDARVYDLTVFATRTEQGDLDISAVVDGPDGSKLDRVVFRNVYAGPVSVSLSARKTLDGGTPKNGAFAFRLLDEKGNIVFEAENQGRSVTFPALTFAEAGTYLYYLKEIKGDDHRIIYDRTVYTAVIEVTKDVGYQVTVTWERNGKPYSGVPAFANYTETGVPKTGDSIGIWLVGLTMSAGALAMLPVTKRRK